MLMTKSYICGREEEVKVGETYYLGQLIDGDEMLEEILSHGCIATREGKEIYIIEIETVGDIDEDILDTLIKVKEIF